MSLRNLVSPALAVLAGMAILGCGEDVGSAPVELPTRIRVMISTTGDQFDLDGYNLAMGDAMPVRVSPTGTYDFVVDPGSYALRLTDVAPNCQPNIDSLLVTVTEGVTVTASFEVNCHSDGGLSTKGQFRFLGTTTGSQIPSFFTGEVYFGLQLLEVIELKPNGITLSRSHSAFLPYWLGISTGACIGGSSRIVHLRFHSYTDIQFSATCP